MDEKELLCAVGKRAAALRCRKSITQQRMAELMNVSVQMISNMENGKKCMRLINLLKLCEILETDPNYLLKGRKPYPIILSPASKAADKKTHKKD